MIKEKVITFRNGSQCQWCPSPKSKFPFAFLVFDEPELIVHV